MIQYALRVSFQRAECVVCLRCRAVDQGSNPDLITKDLLDGARAMNEQTRGKVFAATVCAFAGMQSAHRTLAGAA